MPLVAIHRLAELADHAVPLEGRRSLHVAHQVVAADFQRRIIAPLLRIADFRAESRQLGQGLLLGLGAHPIVVLEGLAVGLDDVLHHAIHARLGVGREVLLHVQLSNRLAQRALDGGDRPFPTRAVLRNAVQRRAVKRESRRRPSPCSAGSHTAGLPATSATPSKWPTAPSRACPPGR